MKVMRFLPGLPGDQEQVLQGKQSGAGRTLLHGQLTVSVLGLNRDGDQSGPLVFHQSEPMTGVFCYSSSAILAPVSSSLGGRFRLPCS